MTCPQRPRWFLRWAALPVLFALVALVVAACGRDDGQRTGRSPLENVPAGADVLASVRVDRILEDVDVQEVIKAFDAIGGDAGGTTTASAAFARLLAEGQRVTGIDFAKARELLLFSSLSSFFGGKPNTPESFDFESGELTLLVQGPYDRARLLEALQKLADDLDSELESTVYKGQAIRQLRIELPSERIGPLPASGSGLAFAFLDSELLAVGTGPGVRAVIDVRTGGAPALSGRLADRYRAQGPAFITIVAVASDQASPGPEASTALTDALRQLLGQSFPLPENLGELLDVRSAQITVKKDVTRFVFEMQIDFRTPAAAGKAKDLLTGLLSLGRGFAPTEAFKEAIDKVQVTAKGPELAISAKLRAKEIADLVRAAQEGLR